MSRRGRILLTWALSGFTTATLAAAAADGRLIQAVRNGDRPAVRSLLAQRVDVNEKQPDGATALAWAAHRNDTDVVELLVKAGADVNAANDYGVTPLSLACTNRNAGIVGQLLDAKANPNLPQWSGETPLMACATTGTVDAVKSLLDHGANPNAATRRGQTALMWAAGNHHPDVTRLLIDRGADVNAVSQRLQGFTPPHYFTFGGPEHSTEEPSGQVHEDPGLSKGGFTALMFAARSGDLESARMLVAARANVNQVSREYGNALLVAAVNGREDVGIYLVENGADANVADEYGFGPLHWALRDGITAIGMQRSHIPSDREWIKRSQPNLVTALLKHGADPNAHAAKGLPPYNYLPFARDDINQLPYLRQEGTTPFLLAAASADLGSMRALVEAGGDAKVGTFEGATPLIVAAGLGKLEALNKEEEARALEAVKLLVQLGADVNVAMKDGRTALMGAAHTGAVSIVQFLVDSGANVNAADRYGQTALGLAQGARIPNANAARGNRRNFRSGNTGVGASGQGPGSQKAIEELLIRLGAKLPEPEKKPAAG